MQLFFQKNGKECVWEGEKWKPVREACVVKVLNAYFAEDLPALRIYTGLTGEKEVTRLVWPVFLLAGQLAAKRAAKVIEGELLYLPAWKEEIRSRWLKQGNVQLLRYLNGEDTALWETWKKVRVFPFYAKENRFGWLVEASNELEAAAAETVLAYMHGWRVSFRVCAEHLFFYHGEECPLCLPSKKLTDRFLDLLGVHKSRAKCGLYAFRGLSEGHREEIQEVIDEIRDTVNREGLSAKLLQDYEEFLRGFPWPEGKEPPVKGVKNLLKEISSGETGGKQR